MFVTYILIFESFIWPTDDSATGTKLTRTGVTGIHTHVCWKLLISRSRFSVWDPIPYRLCHVYAYKQNWKVNCCYLERIYAFLTHFPDTIIPMPIKSCLLCVFLIKGMKLTTFDTGIPILLCDRCLIETKSFNNMQKLMTWAMIECECDMYDWLYMSVCN